jgi:hypothetical protein
MLRSLAAVAGFLVLLATSGDAAAQESLAARIDAQISAKAGGPLAARATDAEFVRRAYLDFSGRIPSATEAREFVADASADKRSKLVARLLDSPEYAHRMSQAFHVMFMERLGDEATWEAWLRASFAANKPWDQMAREILNPDTESEAARPAGHFLAKRLENYGQNAIDFPGLTRDVGRLFLGVDLQCAQCHNHPLIDDYKQHDFQGLFVVYSNLTRRNDVKFPAVSEKALIKKLEFQSVFTSEKGATGPKMPFGMEFELVTFKPGEEFSVPPDKKTNNPGKLKFSPLQVIAENLVKSDNRYFARNAVNRLWFLTMGRGLYHPLDLDHSKNLASHPELLDLLAQEFVSHQFNIKWFLQELAASETYQRSSVLPEGVTDPDPARFTVAIERPLSAEQMLRSVMEAIGERSRLEPATPGDKPVAVTIEPPLPKYEDLAKKVTVAFASAPRDPEIEFAPALKGALFLMNSEPFLTLLKKRSGNLIDRCAAMTDSDKVADELYQSVLGRQPLESERTEVAAYLVSHAADREKAISHLAWALLASTEFCTNH